MARAMLIGLIPIVVGSVNLTCVYDSNLVATANKQIPTPLAGQDNVSSKIRRGLHFEPLISLSHNIFNGGLGSFPTPVDHHTFWWLVVFRFHLSKSGPASLHAAVTASPAPFGSVSHLINIITAAAAPYHNNNNNNNVNSSIRQASRNPSPQNGGNTFRGTYKDKRCSTA
ncbi:hypothetical protein QBC32DRAFT_81494 [Pseudoneurospora amorphoporcata]|uniref:Secreted protein n=1 Tax=Pseudoneurospora amorphoporcata TaxID=241081 RepID=A0AAN6NMF3_9PEZI|nr:hypothetical protein QBC32DRAFT_81494 [Pseudoneurospora amorphoporcata]